MRYMISYDFMETMRNTNQWLGATGAGHRRLPRVFDGSEPGYGMDARLGRGNRAHISENGCQTRLGHTVIYGGRRQGPSCEHRNCGAG